MEHCRPRLDLYRNMTAHKKTHKNTCKTLKLKCRFSWVVSVRKWADLCGCHGNMKGTLVYLVTVVSCVSLWTCRWHHVGGRKATDGGRSHSAPTRKYFCRHSRCFQYQINKLISCYGRGVKCSESFKKR